MSVVAEVLPRLIDSRNVVRNEMYYMKCLNVTCNYKKIQSLKVSLDKTHLYVLIQTIDLNIIQNMMYHTTAENERG